MSDLDLGLEDGIATGVATTIELPEIDIPLYPPMKPGEKAGEFTSIVIDTINELQDNEYLENMKNQGKASFQNYIDLNVNLKVMINEIKRFFPEIVLIIGGEGTGKSFGVKSLDPRHTLWLNTDRKPVTFKGGRGNYQTARGNYLDNLTDYPKILKTLQWAKTKSSKADPVVVFLLGHLGQHTDAKGNAIGGQKLKLIGRFGEKLNIEGAVTNCYYTHLVPGEGGKMQYLLDTVNDGNNTARCLEELFPTRYIPNNFEYIRQQIVNY